MSIEGIIAIAATIVVTLIGVIYKLGHERDKDLAKKLDEHIKEDVRMHERIVRIETVTDIRKEMSVSEEVTRLKERTERLDREIGSHSQRGSIAHRLHEYSKAIRQIFARLNMHEKDADD